MEKLIYIMLLKVILVVAILLIATILKLVSM
jgi:hypothetical protein